MIGEPDPIGLPGVAVAAVGCVLFGFAVVAAKLRAGRSAAGARGSPRSLAGLVLQGLGFALVGAGSLRVVLDPASALALLLAVAVALAMVSVLALFGWAAASMGRHWSLVARTQADPRLVTHGPFAHVRHPIHTALALFLVAFAVALGHSTALLVAGPVFAFGTLLRVVEEERLLCDAFGAEHDAYAARVPRFLPGWF